MTFGYKFTIDKEVNFVYWAQSLIRWGWYFEKQEHDYYRSLTGIFNRNEERALGMFKSILEDKDNYFLWLWSRYVKEPISNPEYAKQWDVIKNTLFSKFELVWAQESQNLYKWKESLDLYDFNRFDNDFAEITHFYAINDNSELNIEIKLCLHWDHIFPAAHVQKNFNDVMLLNLSNTSLNSKPRVVNTILHESIHKIEYNSPLENALLKQVYEKAIIPANIQLKDYKWKHLLEESIAHSIASRRYNNYFGRILAPTQKDIDLDLIETYDFEREKENYEFLIRIIAAHLENLTTTYLNQNRTIDQEYCNSVAKLWVDLYKNRA